MTCRICNTPLEDASKRAHSECVRMQRKGLLFTGYYAPPKSSIGERCQGCGGFIEADHAHRQGQPYHRECLL